MQLRLSGEHNQREQEQRRCQGGEAGNQKSPHCRHIACGRMVLRTITKTTHAPVSEPPPSGTVALALVVDATFFCPRRTGDFLLLLLPLEAAAKRREVLFLRPAAALDGEAGFRDGEDGAFFARSREDGLDLPVLLPAVALVRFLGDGELFLLLARPGDLTASLPSALSSIASAVCHGVRAARTAVPSGRENTDWEAFVRDADTKGSGGCRGCSEASAPAACSASRPSTSSVTDGESGRAMVLSCVAASVAVAAILLAFLPADTLLAFFGDFVVAVADDEEDDIFFFAFFFPAALPADAPLRPAFDDALVLLLPPPERFPAGDVFLFFLFFLFCFFASSLFAEASSSSS